MRHAGFLQQGENLRVIVIAMAVATKVVGRELGGEDQASLVDSFIDELGDGV